MRYKIVYKPYKIPSYNKIAYLFFCFLILYSIKIRQIYTFLIKNRFIKLITDFLPRKIFVFYSNIIILLRKLLLFDIINMINKLWS